MWDSCLKKHHLSCPLTSSTALITWPSFYLNCPFSTLTLSNLWLASPTPLQLACDYFSHSAQKHLSVILFALPSCSFVTLFTLSKMIIQVSSSCNSSMFCISGKIFPHYWCCWRNLITLDDSEQFTKSVTTSELAIWEASAAQTSTILGHLLQQPRKIQNLYTPTPGKALSWLTNCPEALCLFFFFFSPLSPFPFFVHYIPGVPEWKCPVSLLLVGWVWELNELRSILL